MNYLNKFKKIIDEKNPILLNPRIRSSFILNTLKRSTPEPEEKKEENKEEEKEKYNPSTDSNKPFGD